MTESPCITDELYIALLDGNATNATVKQAYEHADRCEPCSQMLAAIARTKAAALETQPAPKVAPVQDDELSPGSTLGRFVIHDTLGEGGMGLVFAAIDPDLQRTVALKVLRSRTSEARGRLLREARAMATIRHPNVVAVHEVGIDRGRVYLVMDHIDGGDLRRWLQAKRHPWTEILRIFIEAGRGLEAAHTHGLVHRDFKPSNVLIGRDGRVAVTDFGLVTPPDVPSEATGGSVNADDVRTTTGTILGTPRYMAPEQLAREMATAASDQFAFCVALFEALCGEHPFGSTPAERAARARSRTLTKVTPRDINRRTIAAIELGLEPDPERRHPDMGTLLTELERSVRAPARRRRWVASVTVVVVAVVVGHQSGQRDAPSPCPSSNPTDIQTVWDASRRGEVREALPDDSAQRVVTALDDYAHAWSAQLHEICLSAAVRHDASEELLERRRQCLEQRRASVEQSVELIVDGRGPSPLEVAYALPSLDPCTDLAALGMLTPRPTAPHLTHRIDTLLELRAQAATMLEAGYPAEALANLDAAFAEVKEVGWVPLEIDYLGLMALAQGKTSPREGLATWRQAYQRAIGLDDRTRLLRLELEGVEHNLRLAQIDDAKFLLGVARTRGSDLEGQEPLLTHAQARVATFEGDYETAETAYRALVDMAQIKDIAPHERGDRYGDLAAILMTRGRFDEAAGLVDTAVEAIEQAYGTTHPRAVAWRANRAASNMERGLVTRAEEELRDLRTFAPEQDQDMLAQFLARVLRSQGRLREALDLDLEAMRRREARLGALHPSTLEAKGAVALDYVKLDELAEAEPLLVAATEAITDQTPHGRALRLLAYLAIVRRKQGQLDAAWETSQQALARLEHVDEAGRDGILVEHQAGLVLLAMGRPADATERLERADKRAQVELERAPDATASRRTAAETRFDLARTEEASGHRSRAGTLALSALELLDSAETEAQERMCAWVDTTRVDEALEPIKKAATASRCSR